MHTDWPDEVVDCISGVGMVLVVVRVDDVSVLNCVAVAKRHSVSITNWTVIQVVEGKEVFTVVAVVKKGKKNDFVDFLDDPNEITIQEILLGT